MKMKLIFLSALCGAAISAWGFAETNLNEYAVTDLDGNLAVLGTEGSYNNNPSLTKAAAFDGDEDTFFDPTSAAASAGGAWCGLEMQTPKICTKVRYRCRVGVAYRIMGCLIQGANNADFSDAQTLQVLNPPGNWDGSSWVTENCNTVAAMQPWKYFRLMSPNPWKKSGDIGSCCGNVSELEFWGDDAENIGDTPPDLPTISFAGQLNGKMNIGITGVESSWVYECEKKIDGTSAWKHFGVCGGRSTDTKWIIGNGENVQPTTYRVRAYSPGKNSDWVETDAIIPTFTLTGSWIGTPLSWGTNDAVNGKAAFNGKVSDYYDGLYGSTEWTGLDFGSKKTIIGIRYVPRNLATYYSRMNGGRFEAANEPDFSDAQLIHAISVTPTFAVTEVLLDTPVTTRYVRYKSPAGGYCNVAEIEFMGERNLPAPTALSVTRSDITNQFPILKWTPSANDGMCSTIVWKATGAGGPWTIAASVPVEATTWTNLDARVGVKNYYRLGSASGADETLFIGTPGSERVAFRRGERIERDWSDNTKLRNGYKSFEYVNSWNKGADRASRLFDGNLSTFADIVGADGGSDNGELMAGVDFGEKVGVTFVRAASRSGQIGRANRHYLFGTDDSSSATNTWSRTKLTGQFSSITNPELKLFEGTSDATFAKVFVNSPTGAGFCNLAELEIYGWRAADVADVLQGPENLTLNPLAGDVHLSWIGCAAATAYRIERAVNDGSEWTVVGTASDVNWVDADVQYDGHIYSYRVTALRGENEEAISDPARIIPYVAGNGTGLRGIWTWPWYKDRIEPAKAVVTNIASTINFDWWTNRLISAASGSSVNVHIAWTGKLIVPFDGEYKFTTDVGDYITLRIGDKFVVNAWGGVAAITDATVALTKGEHPIRIEYCQKANNAWCKIRWGGCVEEGFIPSTQLIPDWPADISPWEGNRTFGTATFQGFADVNGDDIRIGMAGGDLELEKNGYHYLWKTVSGNFDVCMSAKMTDNRNWSKILLMVRPSLDVNAPYFAPALMVNDGTYRYNAKVRTAQGGSNLDFLSAWADGIGGTEGELRIVRNGDTFKGFARAKGVKKWTPIGSQTYAPGTFGSDVKIGVAACCNFANTQPYTHEVSGFTVRPASLATAILLR